MAVHNSQPIEKRSSGTSNVPVSPNASGTAGVGENVVELRNGSVGGDFPPIAAELERQRQDHFIAAYQAGEEWAERRMERISSVPEGIDGAHFLLDSEVTVEAVWGTPDRCLWSAGEPLYICAGPGRGKTTLAQELALHRAGVKGGDMLGLPVAVDSHRVLYIAADRPRQAARSWRRMVSERDRDGLQTGVIVWPQALSFAISSSPNELLPWIEKFGEVGTLFVDSLFNIAPSISDEEGAANANNAIQSVIRAGIELVVIHHDRKATGERKVRVDDIYGGRPLTAGAGSVIYLDGETGTLRATLRHLKQPAATVGPLEVRQDARRGHTFVDGDL